MWAIYLWYISLQGSSIPITPHFNAGGWELFHKLLPAVGFLQSLVSNPPALFLVVCIYYTQFLPIHFGGEVQFYPIQIIILSIKHPPQGNISLVQDILVLKHYSALPPAQEQVRISRCTSAIHCDFPELVVHPGVKQKVVVGQDKL